jgi:hypothetical protein
MEAIGCLLSPGTFAPSRSIWLDSGKQSPAIAYVHNQLKMFGPWTQLEQTLLLGCERYRLSSRQYCWAQIVIWCKYCSSLWNKVLSSLHVNNMVHERYNMDVSLIFRSSSLNITTKLVLNITTKLVLNITWLLSKANAVLCNANQDTALRQDKSALWLGNSLLLWSFLKALPLY